MDLNIHFWNEANYWKRRNGLEESGKLIWRCRVQLQIANNREGKK